MEKKIEKLKVGDKVHLHSGMGTYTIFAIKDSMAFIGTKHDEEFQWREIKISAIKCKHGGTKIAENKSSAKMDAICEFYKDFI
jgi:preprotein translocase subunit YajC